PGDVLDLADNGLAVEVGELHAAWRNHREIAVTQKEEVASVIEDRGNVGSDKVFVLAQPDDGGRAVTRGHDLIRRGDGDNGEGKDAGELAHGFADGLFQRHGMAVV